MMKKYNQANSLGCQKAARLVAPLFATGDLRRYTN
jgi:hypothetical protein